MVVLSSQFDKILTYILDIGHTMIVVCQQVRIILQSQMVAN